MKFEPGTEYFHRRMFLHWSAALTECQREIHEQGPSLARNLTLRRLEALVRENTPDPDEDAKP